MLVPGISDVSSGIPGIKTLDCVYGMNNLFPFDGIIIVFIDNAIPYMLFIRCVQSSDTSILDATVTHDHW